jgi:hypothetical protein
VGEQMIVASRIDVYGQGWIWVWDDHTLTLKKLRVS